MKKPSLSAALKKATREPELVPSAPSADRREQLEPAGRFIAPPSRTGKKAITGFFDPAVSKQLKHIGLERDASVQDLMREALNDLFQKHGRPPIA